jgi:hypothetical protein
MSAATCCLCGQPLPNEERPQLSLASAGQPPQRKARRSDPQSSKRAAVAASVRAGTQRYRILDAILSASEGLTSEQAAQATGSPYVSVSTRCSELLQGGLIERSGKTRATSSGGQSDVLVATASALRALQGAAA